MLYKQLALLFVTMVFFLSGCNSPVYNQTEGNVAEVKLRINDAIKRSNTSGKRTPPLVVNKGSYIDRTPVNLSKQPAWLKSQVIMRGEQLPFSYYSRTIVGSGRNILTSYQVGLDEAFKVSMNYSGTVKGALDLLAAKTGYVYSVNGNRVYWQAFVTKTFDIAFMPGSSDYMMGKSTGNGSITSVASGGGSGAVAVSAIIDDSAASQYSNLKGNLSVWKDLEATIKKLLSAEGSVMVSESTTSVTIRDRPSNVSLVAKYVNNLNHNLTKQVLIKVQVLDVSLENDYLWGIDWSLMKRTLDGTNFFLNMSLGTPVSIAPLSGASLANETLGIVGSGDSSVTAVVTALNQQGKTSIVTEPRVVCINNTVSVMRIIKSTGYLASVQTTSLAGSSTQGGASVTSQLTPGNVVTGLTLYVLPKIMGKKVYLQVNADISDNPAIQTISSATGDVTGTVTNPTAGSSIIQVPTVVQKQFNQRSVINSGETLILSGYRQLTNQANAMQLLNSQALGGKGSQQLTVETIILITPIILPGPV